MVRLYDGPTCSYLDGLRIQTLWYLLSAREVAELSFRVTGPYLQHNTVTLNLRPQPGENNQQSMILPS